MSEQTHRGTHRHRLPLGWHPPRTNSEARDGMPGETTEPFTPAFTGAQPALDGPLVLTEETPPPAPAQPVEVLGAYPYLKRWTFALVVAGVWIVSAAVGVGLYYWWFHSLDKTLAVFGVLLYLVVCTVASLITAMVQNKPLVSAAAIGLMSAPLAAMAGAAVLHGVYFCDRVGRCLAGVLPY